MAKARLGLYTVSGEALTRTHHSCPKCGPGVFLAEHENRRSCGRCGYSESRPVVEKAAPKPEKAKAVRAPKPSAPAPAAPRAPTP